MIDMYTEIKTCSKVEYDRYGNLSYYRDVNGIEYNINGKMTHTINSKGYETWYEYDDKGMLTYFRDSDGYESWYESWYEHDVRWNLVHYRTFTDSESYHIYDAYGILIGYKDSEGNYKKNVKNPIHYNLI